MNTEIFHPSSLLLHSTKSSLYSQSNFLSSSLSTLNTKTKSHAFSISMFIMHKVKSTSNSSHKRSINSLALRLQHFASLSVFGPWALHHICIGISFATRNASGFENRPSIFVIRSQRSQLFLYVSFFMNILYL